MPTITLNIPITTAQETKLNRWFTRWNSLQSQPYASLEEALIEAVLKPNVKIFISEENLLRIGDIPNALRAATDAEQDQVLAILTPYMP